MKKIIIAILIATSFMACQKADEDNSPWSLTQVGIEYNVPYKVQEFVPSPSEPGVWGYFDIKGPVIVTFLNDSTATEKRDTTALNTRSFRLTGRTYWDKPAGYQYNLNFLEGSTPCNASDCPIVINSSGGCVLFNQLSEIVLQKPSSVSFMEAYRFIKQ